MGKYPEHKHDAYALDPNQEEVYFPLEGSTTLVADGERYELRPGTMARVGPDQLRRLFPGPKGVRILALGGKSGSFAAGSWTEIGADPPGVGE